jgi:hypothetical protein
MSVDGSVGLVRVVLGSVWLIHVCYTRMRVLRSF